MCSHPGDLGSTAGKVMWDLWWTVLLEQGFLLMLQFLLDRHYFDIRHVFIGL
jgi:hypothetical protein